MRLGAPLGLILAVAAGCSVNPDARGESKGAADAAGETGGGGSGSSNAGGTAGSVTGAAGTAGSVTGAAGSAGSASAGGVGSDASGRDGGDGSPGLLYPAAFLDLANWKLTLPTGDPGSPTEIKQPALRTFSIDPYFHMNAAGTGVVFQAHAGGVTTSNSGYPRSELREMTNAGVDNAAWSTTSGTHTMTITQAITHLPVVKPHVVAGQVHDASDDVVMIRLEGTKLFVEGGGADLGALDPVYQLGTRFTVKIAASTGHIRIYYNDLASPKVDVGRSATGCYFKAGAYTQSNASRGDDLTAYGEVVIFSLSVTHE
jgi:Alginate lyase